MSYNKFEEAVKEMTMRFIDEWGLSKKNTEDITDKIWEDKESFGEIAFNIICEHIGDDVFFEAFKEYAPELNEDEEQEEQEDEEEDEE